eukprot:6826017-Prymnesium_polylepis.1
MAPRRIARGRGTPHREGHARGARRRKTPRGGGERRAAKEVGGVDGHAALLESCWSRRCGFVEALAGAIRARGENG